jgi:hypothetical protein
VKNEIPYFVPDPESNPASRPRIERNRAVAEDNFKYEQNPNFDEKLVVPTFYRGEKFLHRSKYQDPIMNVIKRGAMFTQVYLYNWAVF